MGKDFKCGCRVAGGAWYLCDGHESRLINAINMDEQQAKDMDEQEGGKQNAIE